MTGKQGRRIVTAQGSLGDFFRNKGDDKHYLRPLLPSLDNCRNQGCTHTHLPAACPTLTGDCRRAASVLALSAGPSPSWLAQTLLIVHAPPWHSPVDFPPPCMPLSRANPKQSHKPGSVQAALAETSTTPRWFPPPGRREENTHPSNYGAWVG